ncbi:MAG TPA: hypothetical protein PKN87_00935 [Syntrophomonadaceae bacterium]|nr:hypothetical protein [Syntrophomonadaceae bacterium]HNX27963.1 hypothetical protein [Syntrophomonadaceae bacterium]HPR94503.1 hypothetical protein [Syntrophomonadaceae bacterium]
MVKQQAIIYVDGSYNPTTNTIGCAIVLDVEATKRPHRIAYSKQLKSQKEYGANIAEMSAVKTAIKTARSLGVTQIYIYHDWNGLEFFSHRDNIKQRHNSCPSYGVYADYIEKVSKNTKIIFIKVKAHSDNELNNLVDKMARLGRTI